MATIVGGMIVLGAEPEDLQLIRVLEAVRARALAAQVKTTARPA